MHILVEQHVALGAIHTILHGKHTPPWLLTSIFHGVNHVIGNDDLQHQHHINHGAIAHGNMLNASRKVKLGIAHRQRNFLIAEHLCHPIGAGQKVIHRTFVIFQHNAALSRQSTQCVELADAHYLHFYLLSRITQAVLKDVIRFRHLTQNIPVFHCGLIIIAAHQVIINLHRFVHKVIPGHTRAIGRISICCSSRSISSGTFGFTFNTCRHVAVVALEQLRTCTIGIKMLRVKKRRICLNCHIVRADFLDIAHEDLDKPHTHRADGQCEEQHNGNHAHASKRRVDLA